MRVYAGCWRDKEVHQYKSAMKKFFRGFVYAWNGIRAAVSEQRNLRIHFAVTALVVAAGVYFELDRIEWCVLALTIALVVSLELVNSSIENLVDLVTKEQHPLARKAKDIAAGAVLIASVISVIIGLIIFSAHWRLLAFGL